MITVQSTNTEVNVFDCRTCETTLPVSEFYVTNSERGHALDCKPCARDRQRSVTAKNEADRRAATAGLSETERWVRAHLLNGKTKRCPHCELNLLVSPENWRLEDSHAGGLASWCKVCSSANGRNRIQTPAGKVAAYNSAMKRRCADLGLPHESYDPLDVFEQNEGVCHICSEPVERFYEHPEYGTVRAFAVEHLIPFGIKPDALPLWIGPHPGNARHNVSVAHASCNSRKGARFSEDAAKLMLKQMFTRSFEELNTITVPTSEDLTDADAIQARMAGDE